MNKFSEYLVQPATINSKPWNTVFLYSGSAALILAIFEPFQYRLNSTIQFQVLLGFVTIAFLNASCVFVLFPKLFKRHYNPEYWTKRKDILNYALFLVISSLCAFIYDYFFVAGHAPTEYGNSEFFRILFLDAFAAMTISAVPMSIDLFMKQNQMLKRHLEEARNLNKYLCERDFPETVEKEMITLNGTTKETVCIYSEALLYLEASGNYVNVIYQEQGNTVKHKLLRTTIKQMEEDLNFHNEFIRCHRAYIVNTNRIANVSGNAQGYRLALSGTDETVPVSRTYMKKLDLVLRR